MKVQFKVPFFETFLTFTGKVLSTKGEYSQIYYRNDSEGFTTTWRKTSELTEIK